MISQATSRFRKAYADLPVEIQRSAKEKHKLWKSDPHHNSLRFRKISELKEIFSIRITKGWRALGLRRNETMIWFWIGSHADYDKLVKNFNRT